jgi:chromosome segregation ATPase-like protein
MSQKLSSYLESKLPLPILDEIVVEDEQLKYHNISYKTNERNAVTYIGAKAREIARQNKINELSNLVENNNKQLQELNSKKSEFEEKLKIATKSPDRKEINKLQIKHSQSEEELRNLEQSLVVISEQLSKLNTTSPTHPALEKNSINKLENLYLKFINTRDKKQNYEAMICNLELDSKRYALELEDSTSNFNSLNNKCEELKESELKLLQELEELNNNENYKILIEEEAALEHKMKNIEDRNNELSSDRAVLNYEYENKTKELRGLIEEYSERTKKYSETENVIRSVIEQLDSFSLKGNYQKDNSIFEEEKIRFVEKNFQHEKLPNSEYTTELRNSLNELQHLEVVSLEDNSSMEVGEYMKLLESIINEQTTSSQELYATAERILKTKLFATVYETYEVVKDTLKQFKGNVEEIKNHNLKLYVDYELNSKDANKPLVLDDLEAQDKLISSMSERIKNIVKNATEQVDAKEVECIIYEELDPIKWFDFYLRYTKDAIVTPEILSQNVINSVSNGERARIFYINVIAMLKTLLPQIKKSAPIIVAMDEAFATVDPTQTKFIIHSLHDISDLLMMTVPNVNKLPITLNTTKANFVRIRKQESSNGNTITFTSPVPMYEEIVDE